MELSCTVSVYYRDMERRRWPQSIHLSMVGGRVVYGMVKLHIGWYNAKKHIESNNIADQCSSTLFSTVFFLLFYTIVLFLPCVPGVITKSPLVSSRDQPSQVWQLEHTSHPPPLSTPPPPPNTHHTHHPSLSTPPPPPQHTSHPPPPLSTPPPPNTHHPMKKGCIVKISLYKCPLATCLIIKSKVSLYQGQVYYHADKQANIKSTTNT